MSTKHMLKSYDDEFKIPSMKLAWENIRHKVTKLMAAVLSACSWIFPTSLRQYQSSLFEFSSDF